MARLEATDVGLAVIQLLGDAGVRGPLTRTDVTDPRGNVRRVTFNAAGYPLTDTRAYGTALAQTTTYVRDATSSLVWPT